MKFCKNCKHAIGGYTFTEYSAIPLSTTLCGFKETGIDLVDGAKSYPEARPERMKDAACGPDATNFEPKQGWVSSCIAFIRRHF